MSEVISKSFVEVAQLLLDQSKGAGKAIAQENGMIKYHFPETHYGCNEMECGSWRVNNNKVNLYTFVNYIEAYEHLKCGTKPTQTAFLNFPKIEPKSIA